MMILTVLWYGICYLVATVCFIFAGCFLYISIKYEIDTNQRPKLIESCLVDILPASLICLGLFLAFDPWRWWYLVPFPAFVGLHISVQAVWWSKLLKSTRIRWNTEVARITSTYRLKNAITKESWDEVPSLAETLEKTESVQVIPELISALERAGRNDDISALRACSSALKVLDWKPETTHHRELMGRWERLLLRETRDQGEAVERQERGSCPSCGVNNWMWDVDSNSFADIRVCGSCGYGRR